MEKRDPAIGAGDEGNTERLSRRQMLALLAAFGVSATEFARAQDAFKVNPHSYKVMFENEKVRVLEYVSGPNMSVCGSGKHSHPIHLIVQLTDLKAKEIDAAGKIDTGFMKAGEVGWSPAVTHTTENIGTKTARAYIVEMKDKDWKPSTG